MVRQTQSSSPLAALYVRVSSDEQVKGHSLAFQERDIRDAAERDGYRVVDVYRDEGFSAKTDKRPEFQRMVVDAKAGKFSRLYIWKYDRFSRAKYDAVVYKELLRRAGVQLLSVKEPMAEPESPAAGLLEGILEDVAQWYSADLKQKMTRAKSARASAGLHNGDVPFGYVKACGHDRCTVKDCDNRLPVPQPDEAAPPHHGLPGHLTGARCARQGGVHDPPTHIRTDA